MWIPTVSQKTQLVEKAQVWIYLRGNGLVHAPRVLILKTTNERGAFWQPVTGKVDPGEDFLTAALREAREESGLPFEKEPVSLKYEFFVAEGRHGPFLEKCFSLEAPAGSEDQVVIDPHEHSEHRWVTISEAMRLLRWDNTRESLARLAGSF